MSVFLFTDDFEALRGKDTLLLMVPSGLVDKETVCGEIALPILFRRELGRLQRLCQ